MKTNKNLRLRKRILRVFKDTDKAKLSTAEIIDKLGNQRTADGTKRYLTHPSITKISNILRYHSEFKRCEVDAVIKYTERSGNYKMANWELTVDAKELME